MKKVFIIDAVRTPIGRFGGQLQNWRPDDLLALVIKGLLERNTSINPNDIEEVIAGAANQAGEDNRNVARMAALLAGLPVSVAGVTVNRLCASGLQAIIDGFRAIRNDEGSLFIVGGTESMTRAPWVMPKSSSAWARTPEIYDTTLGWRFVNPALSALYHPFSMGETAENVAQQWNISREEQDLFAWNSQEKYALAEIAGIWKEEIIPVNIISGKEEKLVDKDEHPRRTTLEKLQSLKPAFTKNGTVTAGNSSGINDGAAALILADEIAVEKYNLTPMVEIIGTAVAGVDPSIMGIGPVASTKIE
jgi:acetyl-CoA acetyltransferase family protein